MIKRTREKLKKVRPGTTFTSKKCVDRKYKRKRRSWSRSRRSHTRKNKTNKKNKQNKKKKEDIIDLHHQILKRRGSFNINHHERVKVILEADIFKYDQPARLADYAN